MKHILKKNIIKVTIMLFKFIKTKNTISPVKYIEPIKNMLNGIWDLSKEFKVPLDTIFAETINTFNLFFKKLNSIISNILKSVVGLSLLAPQLFKISKTFQKTCEDQETNISVISKASIDMSQRIENITQHTEVVANDSELVKNDVKNAMDMGLKSMEQILEIKNFVNQLVEIINVLDDNSRSISSIIDVINDISDETNLLSLNARIEAARSGVYGKGFAVIADEIAELSKQSKDATGDIKTKLTILQNKVKETVGAVKYVENNVNTGEEIIKESNRSLTDVYERFDSFSQNLFEIQSATTHQQKDIKSISNDIINIENSLKFQTKESRTIFEIADQINSICDKMIIDAGIFHLSNHQKAKTISEKIASNPNIISMNRDKQEQSMKEAIKEYNFIELLYITDHKGLQVTSNIYSPKTGQNNAEEKCYQKDWSSKEWFIEPKQNLKTFISKVYRSSATNSFCFTVSVPFFDQNESLCGVLGVDVNFEDMLNI